MTKAERQRLREEWDRLTEQMEAATAKAAAPFEEQIESITEELFAAPLTSEGSEYDLHLARLMPDQFVSDKRSE